MQWMSKDTNFQDKQVLSPLFKSGKYKRSAVPSEGMDVIAI